MADFLLSEAVEEDPTTNDDDEDEGNNNITLSDEEFIDNSNIDEQNASDYYGFTNVMREYDDTIQDSLEDFDYNRRRVTIILKLVISLELMNLKISNLELKNLRKH